MDTHRFDPVRASTDAELRAHSRWLAGVARALIGEGGDDLAQDAWVAALERRPDAERGLKPWFAGALRFLASNERRARSRRSARERSAARDEALPSSDTLAAEIELQRLIADAVSSLDEPERSTLVRRYWHGESAAEIARASGLPAGTVRARLSRALATLRERLDARFDGKRSAWCALLAPLAERDAPTIALTSASGAAVLGVLAKSAAVAAALVLAWLAWSGGKVDTASESARTDGAHVPEIATGRTVDSLGASVVEPPARTPAAVAPASGAASGETGTRATVRARVVDERGAPIAGAELVQESDDHVLSARSASDGRIVLAFEFPETGGMLLGREFLVRAPARTTAEVLPRLARGVTADLGDVVLLPAGTLRGRLVDADGRPLPGLARAALPELHDDARVDERDGPPAGTRLTACVVGVDGRFVLAAVRAGPCRAWCGSTGKAWSHTDVLELRAGETLDVGDVVLAANAATITGRVESSDGAPRAKQLVMALDRESGARGVSTLTGDDGAFALALTDSRVVDLLSYGTFGAGGAAFARAVAAGTHDVVLRHAPAEFVDVLVRDERGAPVTDYRVSVGLGTEAVRSWESRSTPDGRTRVAAWPLPFWISVESRDREPIVRGPFDRSAVGSTVEFVLATPRSVRGRVVRAGTPLAGVYVSLHELATDGNTRVANEFPYAFTARLPEGAHSGADGTFAISTSATGRFVVIAHGPEPLTASSAELELDGRTSLDGVELALDAQGTLAGRATGIDNGAAPWIGISHGDGPTLVTRAAADGTFGFTALAPGRWWIRQLPRDITGDTVIRPRDACWREPQSFVIEDGRTTEVVLDLARVPALEGRLRFGRVPPTAWTAALEVEPATPNSRLVTVLDEHGAFSFSAERHGPAQLVLTDSGVDGARHEIRAAVELAPGAQSLAFDYDEALVRGRAPGRAGRTIALVRIDGGRRAFVTRIAVDAAGRFGPVRSCAGKLIVVEVTPEGALGGAQLLEFELPAGAERELDVP